MRIARIATVLALAIAATTLAAAASAATSGNPTPAQIMKAVAQAERSDSLWATINICNSKRYPGTIGVRGQMPSLGFAAWLSMKIQLNYYSDNKFVRLPNGGSHTTRLGRSAVKLQQGGATWTFTFTKPVLFNASVQFVWRRAGKLLGETTETTTAGHRAAEFGSPMHYTANQCRIP
jgi:opacity protein-like surface antigen